MPEWLTAEYCTKSTLAEIAGRASVCIQTARKWSKALGVVRRSGRRPGNAEASAFETDPRAWLEANRPGLAEQLGEQSDRSLALTEQCSHETVRKYRIALNIPAYDGA